MVHSFRTRFVIPLLIFLGLVATVPGGPVLAAPGDTTRLSIDSSGVQANHKSFLPSISADGRYVAFYSEASNLTGGDTNDAWDVFVHDRQTNTTTCISVAPTGEPGNGFSYLPAISANGRYVAFSSSAGNLVRGDTNNTGDIFVRDLQTNTTKRVSLASGGLQGNNFSYNPSISADGHYVLFASDATNLVKGDTNNTTDVFIRDVEANTTTRISMSSSGVQGNGFSPLGSISADGRYVAFFSGASNLVAGDTNGKTDIFIRSLQANTTTRISLSSSGEQADGWSYYPSISADGRYIAFLSWSTNLVAEDTNGVGDIFVRDTQTNMTTRVSLSSDGKQGNAASEFSAISADGRYVVFDSEARNLVRHDTNWAKDVFIRDTQANTTKLASLDSEGGYGNASSDSPSISADGHFVAFESRARDLVSEDTNGVQDIFVHEDKIALVPAPVVLSITRADPNPAFTSRSVRYTVFFSENVTGVDAADFRLVKSGKTTAAITAVSGSGSTYTVTVETGSNKANLRLDVYDNDSIKDAANRHLGRTGIGNGDFSAGQTYDVVLLESATLRSGAANDGWVLESGEDTNRGGLLDTTADTFSLGDNAQDRQFRLILEFHTTDLPDKAVIVGAMLALKKQGVTGTDPFTTHQNVLVDIQSRTFSSSSILQITDFEAPAACTSVGMLTSTPSSSWYSANLDAAAFPYINLTGLTQFRLAFQLGDNDDLDADTVQFYSGNSGDPDYRPQLQIHYYEP